MFSHMTYITEAEATRESDPKKDDQVRCFGGCLEVLLVTFDETTVHNRLSKAAILLWAKQILECQKYCWIPIGS